MEINFPGAELFCRSDSALEQFSPYASAPLAFENRHAADFRPATAHYQTRCSYGSGRHNREEMNSSAVIAVKLDVLRHTLLSYEHA